MTIIFNTAAYEYEYGKQPKGYGFWGFRFNGHEFWHTGKYAECKRACIKAVKEEASDGYTGYVEVKVLT